MRRARSHRDEEFGGLFMWPSNMPKTMAGLEIKMKNLKQVLNMSMNMMAWLEDNSGGWGEGRRYAMASSAEQERILQHIRKVALWK